MCVCVCARAQEAQADWARLLDSLGLGGQTDALAAGGVIDVWCVGAVGPSGLRALGLAERDAGALAAAAAAAEAAEEAAVRAAYSARGRKKLDLAASTLGAAWRDTVACLSASSAGGAGARPSKTDFQQDPDNLFCVLHIIDFPIL